MYSQIDVPADEEKKMYNLSSCILNGHDDDGLMER